MISPLWRAVVVAGAIVILSGCTGTATEAVTESEPTASSRPTPSPSLEFTDPVDLGPRPGAMGEVTVDEKGVPLTYTVVEGDTADLIRGRFDIWWDQLARDGARLIQYPEIYEGDELTFIPHNPAFEDN